VPGSVGTTMPPDQPRYGGSGGRPPGGGRPALVGRRRRPHWGRIALVGAVALLLFVLAGIGGLYAYTSRLDSNIDRTDAFSEIVGDRPVKVAAGSLNILLLGTDSRDPEGARGGAGAWRADTIMLMHIPSAHDKAYLISIPRDLWVYIPPSADGQAGDQEAKINASFAWGGVPLAVQAVENYTGVRLDHVMMIDFAGFVDVTDALGGVDLQIDQTITSIHRPFRTFEAGLNHLTGEEALDYIRQRYQFPDGDFTRVKNQQAFLKALLDKAVSSGTLTNPGRLNAFLQTATRTLTVDETFSLVDMALQFRNLRSDNLIFLTSPHNGTGAVGDQSVVFSNDEQAATLYQAVREDTMAQWAGENGAEPSGG